MDTKVTPINNLYCRKILPMVYDDSLSYYEAICKFVQKVNEVVEAINNVSIDILNEANGYTDKAIGEFDNKVQLSIEEVYRVREQIYQLLGELDKQYDEFVQLTQTQLLLFNNRLEQTHTRIDDVTVTINERTDKAIEQNNEALLGELGKTLSRVKVLNYFTGEYVALQDMFNYMCLLHVDDSITYDVLLSKGITYNELASRYVKFTDLILHGNTLLV